MAVDSSLVEHLRELLDSVDGVTFKRIRYRPGAALKLKDSTTVAPRVRAIAGTSRIQSDFWSSSPAVSTMDTSNR